MDFNPYFNTSASSNWNLVGYLLVITIVSLVIFPLSIYSAYRVSTKINKVDATVEECKEALTYSQKMFTALVFVNFAIFAVSLVYLLMQLTS